MPKQSPPETLFVGQIGSPLGAISVVHDKEGRLHALEFEDRGQRMQQLLRLYHGNDALLDRRVPPGIKQPLERYFAGDLTAIDSIPIATAGTPFQRDVWAALRQIPPGETRSYGALARKLGRPNAVRAVGAANGANPINIVVPCHRVIGADGSLTGYGGGIDRKRWLLAHEGTARRSAAS